MAELSDEQKKQIQDALEKRVATVPRPRCGNRNSIVLDGQFDQPLSKDRRADYWGPSVPSIVLACLNRGYLSQHTLGVLGLLPTPKEGKSDA
jgi:hypothetical protein